MEKEEASKVSNGEIRTLRVDKSWQSSWQILSNQPVWRRGLLIGCGVAAQSAGRNPPLRLRLLGDGVDNKRLPVRSSLPLLLR